MTNKPATEEICAKEPSIGEAITMNNEKALRILDNLSKKRGALAKVARVIGTEPQTVYTWRNAKHVPEWAQQALLRMPHHPAPAAVPLDNSGPYTTTSFLLSLPESDSKKVREIVTRISPSVNYTAISTALVITRFSRKDADLIRFVLTSMNIEHTEFTHA